MNKPDRSRPQVKSSGQSEFKGRSTHSERTGIYYDRDNGEVGFGNKYGERSFNQRPIHADPAPRSGYPAEARNPPTDGQEPSPNKS